MSTVYFFEEERLKPVIAAYLNSGCNFNEVSSHLKKQMRLFMQENIPVIQLSDGKHSIESHFTKEAINDFRKNYSNVKFSNLRDKILVVTKWRLITRYEDSRLSYSSYQNISIHLVVENFRPLMYERVANKCMGSDSIFRDGEIQCLLRNKRHETIQQEILHKHFFMHNNDLPMPSARDLFESDASLRLKKLPEQDNINHLGIMFEITQEEIQMQKDIQEKKEFERNMINDFNKEVIQKVSAALLHNEVLRCGEPRPSKESLVNDMEDFKEMRDLVINTPGDILNIDHQQNNQIFLPHQYYYDVKRLLVQEKGEEDYYFLFEKMQKKWQEKIEDEITRQELTQNYEHFHNQKDKSRLEFQRQMQIKAMQNAQVNKRRTKKVVRFRLGYQASEVKERILRFMATFNPTQVQNNEETYLEEKNDFTTDLQDRAYSQIDRNDRSELIEFSQKNHGGHALSQYYQGPQSIVGGRESDTESEPDDQDPLASLQKQQVRSLVSEVKPTLTLFKRYYEWFNQHEVTTKTKYEELQENMRRAMAEAAAKEAELQRERERKEREAKEREARELEAQRLREEQIELERIRKQERKIIKLQQKKEEEERRQREFQEEAERQRLAELAIEEERQKAIEQAEREAAEQKRNQEIAQANALKAAEQEKERLLQLEITAAAESLRKIKIDEERRRLQEEAVKAKHEETLREQRKLEEQREQERLLAEVKARAEMEEAQRYQRKIQEYQERVRREEAAALQAEQSRQQEIAEKRRQEELAAKERERQKQIAAQEALKKEQERQEKRRIQLEQEAQEQRAKYEEEKRLFRLRQEEEQRRAKQEAEIERKRYEEQLRIETEERLKRERDLLAIQALSGKVLKPSFLSQKASQNEEEPGLILLEERSSVTSDENEEDGDQQTAAFVIHSQDDEFSPEQVQLQEQVQVQPQTVDEIDDQSPEVTPNKSLATVFIQPSPGSFVDQNPVPLPYDESLTLADLVGQHQNGSQQLKTHTIQDHDQKHSSNHRHQSKKHKRSQSSHSKSKKHNITKKRRHRSSSSQSSSSNDSDSESRSLSSISKEASDVDSSEQRSSRSESSSSSRKSSERSSSSGSSASSTDQRKQAELLLSLFNPKKSSKSKKDKKHKSKGNMDIFAQLLKVAATMQSKHHKKDRSSKKHHHKSSASKSHHNYHASSHVKDEKPQSVQKIPQPFTLDHQFNSSPNLEIKQSPSPQKPGVNYSYKHLDSTQGSTEQQVQKQLSPVEIVKTSMRVNAMPTSFDSWKQQNENQNGQNFRNASPQQSQTKVIPPWNQTRDEEEDNSEQLALLLAQDKALQKRRRHE